ncbi:MAG: methyltransferase domain-containing protein [Nanobdellota archaeon]
MKNNFFLERYEKWGYPQKIKHDIKNILRLNLNHLSPKKFRIRMNELSINLEKVPFLEEGYYYDSEFPIVSTQEYLLGHFYIQEAPAQLIGNIFRKLVKNKNYEGIKVLDMAASPGGKTSHISEIMRNKGRIDAIDIDKERSKKLRYNLERMRVNNCYVYQKDSKDIFKEKYDFVLLDAPCSGNFTQEKEWLEKRNIEDIKNRQELQKNLMDNAIRSLKKEGFLIYSTCSLEKEENEEIIEHAIENNLEIINLHELFPEDQKKYFSKGLTEETKGSIRFWPTQNKQPGFFIAVMKKT